MSDIAEITVTTRYITEDFLRTLIPGDIFTYTTSSIFTLSEPNVSGIVNVLKNSVVLISSDYSFNSTTNQVTISASLSSGDTIEIRYTYYSNYSDLEIEGYIRAAVAYLSVFNYETFEVDETGDNFYPDLTDKERNLVSLIASILIKPGNVSYRLPDISFNVPVSLPTRDIIGKTIAIFKKNTHGIFTLI